MLFEVGGVHNGAWRAEAEDEQILAVDVTAWLAGSGDMSALYRLGHHPRRTDHPALLHADGTVAATFAYNATREHIIASLEHAGLVLHADDTVEPDGERPKEGGEIAAAFAAGKVLSDAQDAFALGRQLAAAQMAYDAFDAASLAQGGGGDRDDGLNARSILNDRIEALRTLISTTPAKSLKDAAGPVAESLTVAGRLAGCELNLHMAEKYRIAWSEC